MQETFSVSLTALLSVFCVIASGFLLRRIGVLTKNAGQSMLNIVVHFLMPCLILDRVLLTGVFSDVRNLYYPPLLGFGAVAIGVLVGTLCGRLPSKWTGLETAKQRGTFACCIGIVNYGFVPIPLIQILFGDNDPTMGVLFVHNLGSEFALWTVCLLALQGSFSRNSWKHLISGPTVAILLAIPLNLFFRSHFCPGIVQNALPSLTFLKQALHLLGFAAIPMSMMLIGGTMADHLRINLFIADYTNTLKIAFWSCLIRLVILPIGLLTVAIHLPCSLELKRVLVMHSAMGSAIFPIVMAEPYGGDQRTALLTVLSNSFLSLLTLPIWITLGLHWIQ